MLNNGLITFKKNSLYIYIFIFLVVFLAGLMNSANFFIVIGLNDLNTITKICFYLLLASLFLILLINNLLTRNSFLPEAFPYWSVLLCAVLLNYFILFIQNPSWIFPGGKYFSDFFHFILILTIMIVLAGVLRSYQAIKLAIWGLALGSSFSALIPFLFYPEMIGSRDIDFQGHHFSGGFWNSSVISYISVGWLAVSLSTLEKSKIKSFFLMSLFLIMAIGGIAGLSRATLLSVVISVCVYIFFAKKFKKYIKVILSGAIIVFFVISFFPDLFTNFSARLEGGIDIEEEGRTKIWLDYLQDLPSYFLFGAIDGDYTKYSIYGMGPHSTILNWITQFGILGLLGFVILILGLVSSIKKIKVQFSIETSSALLAWLAAYLSVALINETGFKQLTVFAAFGIIMAWGNLSKKLNNDRVKSKPKI